MRITPPRRMTLAGTLLSLTLVSGTQATTAAMPLRPLPGERILTVAERQLAMVGMDAAERAEFGPDLSGAASLPVAYTRRLFALRNLPDGSTTLVPVGAHGRMPGSGLDIPSLESAGTSGNAWRHDLYVSILVARNQQRTYSWTVKAYFKWHGANGFRCCNSVLDRLAVAWSGGMALYSDTAWGYYHDDAALDIYRSSVEPNEGIEWAFHEQRQCMFCGSLAEYAIAYARITESKWQGRIANVVVKYFHTKGGTSSYTLTFGPASVTIAPSDGNQWSLAAYADFTH